ncbi:MAG TPA: ATP-binding protein [Longimicrobium sp.]|jgi:two-component system sensor histidine kinase PilS (NtrC family)|uniref:ATP-binding protein n=1 Tax=Longimicrobium sp. TaxID=2029185 RepID=UPI002ED9C7F3
MRERFAAGRLPQPRRVLAWVYLGRLCLAGAIFVAAALVWKQAEAHVTLAASLLLVLAAAFTAGSFWYTHLTHHAPGRAYLYAQVLFDVALVATVVHLTGGPESDFVPLFVLVIVAAAILLPFLGGVLIGVLVSLLFFADIVLSTGTIAAGSILQIVLFAAVALATGYLGDRLRHTGAVLGEVETELRLLRLDTDDVLASIATGLITVDGAGRLAFINPAAADLLHIRASDWLGRPFLAKLDAVAPGLGRVIAQSSATRTPVRRYETDETDAGMVFGVSTTLIQRDEGGPPSVTAIFQDITERKRMDQLRGRAERLEAVAELSASLAHEIKNPLASIRSATEQLAGEGIDADDRVVLGGLVVRESDRLSRLLTEFIDFARAKLRAAERLDLARLVRHVVDVVKAHPQARGIDVSFSVDADAEHVAVHGDEDLLHRAVLNLALNAVQWAGQGGRVEVCVDAVDTDLMAPRLGAAHAVRIRVSDTGPGVPEENAEHIFDPFFTRRPGGTGLGLALVQRAADAHGGAVFVDQSRGDGWGATFAFYLPALPDVAAGVETAVAEEGEQG